MAISVYDWMVARKPLSSHREELGTPRNEDILVRILKMLDAEASKTPVPST